MKAMRVLGTLALGFLFVMPHDAQAQRRGGAVSGGMRGAVVGGMVGGEGGAAKGAKVGMVTGATRSAIDRETVARTQYQSTAQYQNAQHANFNETPPEVVATTGEASPIKPEGEAIIRRDGKPIVGITFPSDWKQKISEKAISAVSGDGEAYSMIASLDEIADKEGGIQKIKEGLTKYLKDIKYDEMTKTKGGALLITGSGMAKKAGVEVVFAAAVFDAGKGQLVGAAFVVDAKIEDHYKETIRGICETLRRASDFTRN